MDENYKRDSIKAQIREMLATPKSELAEIGHRNRLLWEKAHDVRKMALETRMAIGIGPFKETEGQTVCSTDRQLSNAMAIN